MKPRTKPLPWRPRPVPRPTLVITKSATRLAERSRNEPGTLFVDPVRHHLARDGVLVRTTRLQVAFVVALASHCGAVIPTGEMADLLYGDAPGGAPRDATNGVNVLAASTRPALAALGYRIETEIGRGRWLRCCLSPVNPDPEHTHA